jgi:peptide chain release factor 3
MKLSNVLTFMANERVASEDAVAGDIIGIHNHGQLSIGDTLTEGEVLEYKGSRTFAPELFRVARPRDPFRSKPLQEGLAGAWRRGAIQVFESIQAGTLLLGAVGPLQFEIVAHRLATEYKVDAIYDTANISTARWLTFPDENTRRNFEREQAAFTRDRRRRQPGIPRDEQVQPSGHDGALAEGGLSRDARARPAARARMSATPGRP